MPREYLCDLGMHCVECQWEMSSPSAFDSPFCGVLHFGSWQRGIIVYPRLENQWWTLLDGDTSPLNEGLQFLQSSYQNLQKTLKEGQNRRLRDWHHSCMTSFNVTIISWVPEQIDDRNHLPTLIETISKILQSPLRNKNVPPFHFCGQPFPSPLAECHYL